MVYVDNIVECMFMASDVVFFFLFLVVWGLREVNMGFQKYLC